jgi:hypothetical protein
MALWILALWVDMDSGVMVCDIMDFGVIGCVMDPGVMVCDIIGYGIMDTETTVTACKTFRRKLLPPSSG